MPFRHNFADTGSGRNSKAHSFPDSPGTTYIECIILSGLQSFETNGIRLAFIGGQHTVGDMAYPAMPFAWVAFKQFVGDSLSGAAAGREVTDGLPYLYHICGGELIFRLFKDQFFGLSGEYIYGLFINDMYVIR